MADKSKLSVLKAAERIWVIAAINGDIERLSDLHDNLVTRIKPIDRVVYTGNYLGHSGDGALVLDELILFRRWFLSIPHLMNPDDIVFLRGANETMWQKLLQLQSAPDPYGVLSWMLERGLEASIKAYGGVSKAGLDATNKSKRDIALWTQSLIDVMAQKAGHFEFFSGLKHAATTENGHMLIVHTGLDVTREITQQSDAFWWAGRSFHDLNKPYNGFRRIIRGYDPLHAGVIEKPYSFSIDAGCGYGGKLVAICFSTDGDVLDEIQI